MAASAAGTTARLRADDADRLMRRLESGLGGDAGGDAQLWYQYPLSALDDGEHRRFVVWPADDPAGVLYVSASGTLVPAGDPAAGPHLADAAERAGWSVLVGDAPLARSLLHAWPRGLLRRRPKAREQRFMLTRRRPRVPATPGFRPAHDGDLQELTDFACRLHVEDEMGPPISRSGQEVVRARARDRVARGATWVVERRGRPVAKVDVALCSRRRGAQLAGVYVERDWRGRGLGAAAVGLTTRHLLDAGVPGVTLHVRSDNVAAIAAYRRAGLVDAGALVLALR
ncbi:MAG: GNAT family N-acetyltransferase [Actinobacteria bacterium]|nr:GNAT family N-acetyltransferase [Actinomycetota bacterium]